MRDAYIVTSIRTPGCKRNKGAFKDTRPEDLLSFILSAAVERTPDLEKKDVEDIMIGCSFPEAEQGLNIGRLVNQIAGFPVEVSGATVNRFCSSGLEAIALATLRVMAGWSDVTIGGGVESMTYVPVGGHLPRPHPEYSKKYAELYVSMGITAENVARRYNISRESQDEFAWHSHQKAAHARANNLFTELLPTPAARFVQKADGTFKKETFLQDVDDGIRENTTLEGLAGLNPVFAANGTVTAGNSSQTTDGAAATIILSENILKDLDLTPIAKLKCYTTVGCKPDEMGLGPLYAIPRLLKLCGMDIKDIGLLKSMKPLLPRRCIVSKSLIWIWKK
jgi:acetyl-CoA acyltransferase